MIIKSHGELIVEVAELSVEVQRLAAELEKIDRTIQDLDNKAAIVTSLSAMESRFVPLAASVATIDSRVTALERHAGARSHAEPDLSYMS